MRSRRPGECSVWGKELFVECVLLLLLLCVCVTEF
jgi:hypothetical protein